MHFKIIYWKYFWWRKQASSHPLNHDLLKSNSFFFFPFSHLPFPNMGNAVLFQKFYYKITDGTNKINQWILTSNISAEPKMATIEVNSPNVSYTSDFIQSKYVYQNTKVDRDVSGNITATPIDTVYLFRTQRRVPKLGVMLVGWGGNNGSTITATILANKHNIDWPTKDGLQKPNYFGSITQASTVLLGTGPEGEVYVPMKSLLPMVDPDDLVLDGECQNYLSLMFSVENFW